MSLNRKCILSKQEKWGIGIPLFIIFCGIYIFFRYVHPVVPWDGDDWGTITAMSSFEYGIPRLGLKYSQSERFFAALLGTVAGYFAAFVVYPCTGDYVMSFVIVAAFSLSVIITAELAVILCSLYHFTRNIRLSMVGVFFFLIGAFLIFKGTAASPYGTSTYLYWQYNYCTTYYYSIPSYLALISVMLLLLRDLSSEPFRVDIRSGLWLTVLYCLIFSFLPASFLLTVACSWIFLIHLLRERNLKKLMRENWICVCTIPLFVLKLSLEAYRIYSIGYFEAPTGLAERFAESFRFMIHTFADMNPLFLVVATISVLCAVYSWRTASRTETDTVWFQMLRMSVGIFVLVWLFYLFFGVLDLGHLVRRNLPARLDTLHICYFLFLWIITLCFTYALQKSRYMMFGTSFAVSLMAFSVLSPTFPYSGSHYIDTTAKQRYEIMSEVIQAAIEKDRAGENELIVHLPKYGHYENGRMAYTLRLHHILDHDISIKFVYDNGRKEIAFE